jgi:hypothetical protein
MVQSDYFFQKKLFGMQYLSNIGVLEQKTKHGTTAEQGFKEITGL